MRFARITLEADKAGGMPCIRGLRIPVATVVDTVADGMSAEEILDAYPDLKAEDVAEALRYAAEAVREREAPRRSGTAGRTPTLPVMSTDPGPGPTGSAPTVVLPEVTCGFCERVAASGVVRVVAGPGLYICERCVDDALEAFQDVPPRAGADAAAGAATAADAPDRCGFCRRSAPPDRLWRGRATVQAEAHGELAAVCDECVELCVEVLAEG